MKKLVFAAVAAIALMASVSFVSCNKKAAAAADSAATVVVDSAADVIEEVVDSAADAIVAADSIVAE